MGNKLIPYDLSRNMLRNLAIPDRVSIAALSRYWGPAGLYMDFIPPSVQRSETGIGQYDLDKDFLAFHVPLITHQRDISVAMLIGVLLCP